MKVVQSSIIRRTVYYCVLFLSINGVVKAGIADINLGVEENNGSETDNDGTASDDERISRVLQFDEFGVDKPEPNKNIGTTKSECPGEVVNDALETRIDIPNSVVTVNKLHEPGGELRYSHVGLVRGRQADLVVTVTSGDYPDIYDVWLERDKKPKKMNGKKDDSKFGNINLQTVEGKPDSGLGNFKMCFYDTETNELVTVDQFAWSVFDIDERGDDTQLNGIGLKEKLIINTAQATSFKLMPNSEIVEICEDGSELPCPADVRSVFASSQPGTAADNPKDPNDLDELQLSRTVLFTFIDTSCWEFSYDHYCPVEQDHNTVFPLGYDPENDKSDTGRCRLPYTGGNFLFSGKADQLILNGECITQSPTIATPSPTSSPTDIPTDYPTYFPTEGPTDSPTDSPTSSPTLAPSDVPSSDPSDGPTVTPTFAPTDGPTFGPTDSPSDVPSANPTAGPSGQPTSGPTESPTVTHSHVPTVTHSVHPTITGSPTEDPTPYHSRGPTTAPTSGPTDAPTDVPTGGPTTGPTDSPTDSPTSNPTEAFSDGPSSSPTGGPTDSPTGVPTGAPTDGPSLAPSSVPTDGPSDVPTGGPTGVPTTAGPSLIPSFSPTDMPSAHPSKAIVPSLSPTDFPSLEPSEGKAECVNDGNVTYPETCPDDVVLVKTEGTKEFPPNPTDVIKVVSQDVGFVTVALNQAWEGSSDIDHIYYAYREKWPEDKCYEVTNVSEDCVFATFTMECHIHVPYSLIEICIVDNIEKKYLGSGDNATVPQCCYPEFPKDTPVACYTIEVKCASECVTDSRRSLRGA